MTYGALKRFYATSTGAGSVYEAKGLIKIGLKAIGKNISKTPITGSGGKSISRGIKGITAANVSNVAGKIGMNTAKIGIPAFVASAGLQMRSNQLEKERKKEKYKNMSPSDINKMFKDYEDERGKRNLIKQNLSSPSGSLATSYVPDGELTEKVMTKKDIKKRDEIADAISTKDMKDRYGDKNVKYAIATKMVMDKKKKKKKMNENIADEALLIQDWNKDDIKFTEIETVDVIKPKPIKEDHSNWRDDLGEDWQKENRKDKTDGLSQKAVDAYRRENPGSKLKTAVTKDPKKLTSAKTSRDPDSRINKALRRWNC